MRKLRHGRMVLASHNRGKLEEISALLRPFPIEVVSAAEFGLDEPAETEDSFLGNARIKAHFAAKATRLPALADDSGISVDALGGAPGVYTADWAETPTGRDFDMAMEKTWHLTQETGTAPPFRAQFRCTLVLAWPDGHDEAFEGRVEGQLVWPKRGMQGHGYDPMFQPDGFDVTFGEMNRWQKNSLSHRADAFRKLVAGCFT